MIKQVLISSAGPRVNCYLIDSGVIIDGSYRNDSSVIESLVSKDNLLSSYLLKTDILSSFYYCTNLLSVLSRLLVKASSVSFIGSCILITFDDGDEK